MFRHDPRRTGYYGPAPLMGLDVYVGSDDNYLYLLDGNPGALIDRFLTYGWIRSSPSIADIDGDKKLEILFYDWGCDPEVRNDTFWCVEDRTGIYIDSPNMTITPCEEFTVNIDIADVDFLYAWELKISFDPTLVECIDVVEGSFLQSAGLTVFVMGGIDNTAGYAWFGCTLLSPAPSVTGSGTLATVTFHCLGPGDTDLHLYETLLYDETMTSIPHNTADGLVSQRLPPVGGVWIPINKFELLAPWIGLVSVIASTVAASVVYVKRRKKEY